MFISIAVIAYNEEQYIDNILADIDHQDYDHAHMEVVLVDSASKDATKDKMLKFSEANKTFKRVVVLDNPKKTLPCGWNVLLDNYQGDAVIRVDAHSHIPSDFVSKNVSLLMQGEKVCGGRRPNIIDEPTPWKNTLLLAEDSMFGSSIAPYRKGSEEKEEKPIYMKSLFHAAYSREVFEKIGHYNEKLSRTEDNEIHYRMREAGYRLRFDPNIVSYQHTRSSLKKMLKQKYANGLWIGKTAKVCPKCLSLYHFVPWAFVVAIIISTIACLVLGGINTTFAAGATGVVLGTITKVVYGLTGLMWGAYWLLAIIMAIIAVIGADKKRNISCILLPMLFFLLHISYGIGTVVGLASKKLY